MSISLTESAALQLVTAALESKAITLLGTDSRQHGADRGKADAEYLKALIEGLMKQTP